jgi:hypothetical protein
MFLALAALTRHPYWAAAIRLLTGGWIVAAPYFLVFADIVPALRGYLTIRGLIAAAAIPGFSRIHRSGKALNAISRGVEGMEGASS